MFEKLCELYPGIVIAGTYEPPRASVEEMNNAEIVTRIAEAHADVLLVALGHPKQERWIDLHRDQPAFEERHRLLQDADVTRGRDVTTRRKRQPQVIIRAACAHTAAPRWMPPVLDITLEELARRSNLSEYRVAEKASPPASRAFQNLTPVMNYYRNVWSAAELQAENRDDGLVCANVFGLWWSRRPPGHDGVPSGLFLCIQTVRKDLFRYQV